MVGDPKWLTHPVQIIGAAINYLRKKVESIAKNNILKLRIGGLILTILVVSGSVISGWLIERIGIEAITKGNELWIVILTIPLASSLAAKSLEEGVNNVIKEINKEENNQAIDNAKKKLKLIVGRDVNQMNKEEILRATAETASENSIDGIFAPLFWMLIGAIFWEFSNNLPGPLSFAWGFKATSTIDSMIGYKQGNLRWLGTAGAKLDDILTWIPCRLVVSTLPLISKKPESWLKIINISEVEGSKYDSPNAGRSQAIFANCIGIRMGGNNKYNGMESSKPLIGINQPKASIESIKKIISLTYKLQLMWLLVAVLIFRFRN